MQRENKNRNTWKLGVVSELIKGKDSIVRGAKLRTANGELERAVQHLYPPSPTELTCDETNFKKPNPAAPCFQPKATRDAAVAARLRIQTTVADDGNEFCHQK